MKSAVKKLIVIGCIVAVLCVGALIDFAISLTYKIEFVSVVRLTESGEPVTEAGEGGSGSGMTTDDIFYDIDTGKED